jgi:hypothetical protein
MVGGMSGRSNVSDRSHKSRRLSKFVALKKLEMCKRQNSDCSKQPQVASLSCLACTFQFLATICVAAKRISFATYNQDFLPCSSAKANKFAFCTHLLRQFFGKTKKS